MYNLMFKTCEKAVAFVCFIRRQIANNTTASLESLCKNSTFPSNYNHLINHLIHNTTTVKSSINKYLYPQSTSLITTTTKLN